jgi:two-component system response regulator (stage 0 sporulation protein A)
MKKIRVLIADDNYEFANLTRESLEIRNEIEVVGIAADGLEAIEMVNIYNPDVLVLDLIMPRLDGLGALEKLKLTNSDVKVIVLSPINTEGVIIKTIETGADYFMLKPCDVESLCNRIIFYGNNKNLEVDKFIEDKNSKAFNFENNIASGLDKDFLEDEDNMEFKITNIIHSIGVPAHVKGYQYIRESIKMVVEDVSSLGCITKIIYPAVAKKYDTTSSRVERGIRHAIEIAWNKGNKDMMRKYFTTASDYCDRKPTNSEFIAVISDKLRLEDRALAK